MRISDWSSDVCSSDLPPHRCATGRIIMSLPVVCCHSLFPFVSSEVETPVDLAPSPMGISTSLDANGWDGRRRLPVECRLLNVPRRGRRDRGGESFLLCGLCANPMRSEEHTSELQSLMRISYAVLCLK